MKKIYLLTASFIIAVMSFGQTYDLQLDLVTPTSQSSVQPGNVSISFNLINNGPDAVPGEETIWFSYIINPQLGTGGAQIFDLQGNPDGATGVILPPTGFPSGQPLPSAALHSILGGPIVFDLSSYPNGTIVAIQCWGAGDDLMDLAQNGDPRDGDVNNNGDFFIIDDGAPATVSYDLALALTTPVSQSTVPQSATQTIEFTITNNGPDAIPAGDTLLIGYINLTTNVQYGLDGTPGGLSGEILTQPIPSGFSATSTQMNQGVPLVLNTTAAGFNVGDPIMVIVSVLPNNDSDLSNDGDFFILGPTAGVENTIGKHFSVFPNPATDVLNISSSEEVANVSVLSLDGKVVSTTNGKQVDVSKLKTGVYIYEVTTVSGEKVINKFMKK